MSTEAAAADDASTEHEHTEAEAEAEAEPETVIGYLIQRRALPEPVDDDAEEEEEEVRRDPWTPICRTTYIYRKNAAKRMAELRAERGETREYKLVEVRESVGGDRREVDVGSDAKADAEESDDESDDE